MGLILLSQNESLLLNLRLQSGLIICAHQHVLEWATDCVVLSLSEVSLSLISEHPVLNAIVIL